VGKGYKWLGRDRSIMARSSKGLGGGRSRSLWLG